MLQRQTRAMVKVQLCLKGKIKARWKEAKEFLLNRNITFSVAHADMAVRSISFSDQWNLYKCFSAESFRCLYFMNHPFFQGKHITEIHSHGLPKAFMTKPMEMWRTNRANSRRETMWIWICVYLFCPSQKWMDASVQINEYWPQSVLMNDNFYKMEK